MSLPPATRPALTGNNDAILTSSTNHPGAGAVVGEEAWVATFGSRWVVERTG
ncbi:hypothetical protein [Cryptosporangium phraense]|uniref:hypothetical protein n=1 Tax=Cryptosporangium phraense TaxID=2593070 RepID=UPI0014785239|nr:hypothetical protein [Cryptosporangium phraense]